MKTRIIPFIILLFSFFIILWSRLFYLEILQGKQNNLLAQENRIRIIKVPGTRGVIFDRESKILVRNRQDGREYLYPETLAHVLGYLGETDEKDLEDSFYEVFDIIGKSGIEKQYDKILRGRDGRILVETDSLGKIIREIKKEEPQAGKDLALTLDLDLQLKAFSLLKGRKGAIIASNPKTGEILSLVSLPSFDPNLFTLTKQINPVFERSAANEESERQTGFSSARNKEINQVLQDPNQPLFNRAITGLYPPGSTFKIVTALSALEEEKITKDTQIEDTGEIKVGPYTYSNWYFLQYGGKDGQVNVVKAIKRSNDIFFYQVGERLGINKLALWSERFGLGKILGIDLPGEAAGLIPTPQWKKEVKTENWYLGDTYITAIGQGNLLLTPLAVNQVTSIIAAQGKSCTPHLLKDRKVNCEALKIKPENLQLVKEGMKEACTKGGTASVFFDFKPQVACKTGTAEYGLTGQLKSKAQTHAWFTVFAPADEPEIGVTVLLEGAGEGSKEAAPIARDLLKYWFKKLD